VAHYDGHIMMYACSSATGNVLAKSSSDTNRDGIVVAQTALGDLVAYCLHSGHAPTYPDQRWSTRDLT